MYHFKTYCTLPDEAKAIHKTAFVQEFYKKSGCSVMGEEFSEEYCPHIPMRRTRRKN